MSRPLRIEYQNCWYHVMNRGRRYEDIFLTTEDYHLFIQVVKESVDLFGLRISAYCLMPNHYHLLVQTPHGNLSRCMRHINGVYTQRFNRHHDKDGQLFRGRYKAIVVEDDRYLLEVLRYIHQNPVKADLASCLKGYPWSSHCGYVSSAKKWDWLYKEKLLSMLESRKTKQTAAYQDFIGQSLPEEIERFYSQHKLSPLLGSISFIERIKAQYGRKSYEKELSYRKSLAVSENLILNVIASKFALEKENLIQLGRGQDTFPRDLAMYLIQQYRMDSLQTISGYFGNIHYSTVSNSIARVKQKIESSLLYRTILDEVKNEISRRQGKT